MPSSSAVYLLDANAIIEAVRAHIWNALTGGLDIQSVTECRDECRRGDSLSSGYISVSDVDLDRMSAVHSVSEQERASLSLHTDVSSLDNGELDLYAHALGREDPDWLICSPDIASVKVGVALGWQDQLISLEEMIAEVGERPSPPLRMHFKKDWLSRERTKALLGP